MIRTDVLNATLAALAAATLTVVAPAAKSEEAPTLTPVPVAGSTCAARETVVARLASRFGETRRGIGLGTKNRVVEIFASPESGSWTITVTLPDGRTCLLATGQSWEDRMDDLSHLADAPA